MVSSQSAAAGLAEGEGELVAGELVHHGRHLPGGRLEPVLGVTADNLGDRNELAGRGVGLDPVPRAHQPGQLMISYLAEGSRSSQAGSSSHPGSAGAGDAAIEPHASRTMIDFMFE